MSELSKARALRCPACQGAVVEEGAVFIEDGPWDGRHYRNEGEVSRFLCKACGQWFALIDPPLACSKCGEEVAGELGEDCDEAEGSEPGAELYLCRECMAPETGTQKLG